MTGGLIPAHAGKTQTEWADGSPHPAHPRSRGENARGIAMMCTTHGSSPLTRGKLSAEKSVFLTGRLIPAHAGKTWKTSRTVPGSEAHPRSRGENMPAKRRVSANLGSSPLTRGKPASRRARRNRGRLIPAHAGKTRRPCGKTHDSRAHPRSRGENSGRPRTCATRTGSSPLTRGKRACRERSLVGLRLIPAHAGKTSAQTLRSRCARAHPRSRGENSRWARRALSARGSSPLTRGKLLLDQVGDGRERLIPAHAGKTSCVGLAGPVFWAHPRSRGENWP